MMYCVGFRSVKRLDVPSAFAISILFIFYSLSSLVTASWLLGWYEGPRGGAGTKWNASHRLVGEKVRFAPSLSPKLVRNGFAGDYEPGGLAR